MNFTAAYFISLLFKKGRAQGHLYAFKYVIQNRGNHSTFERSAQYWYVFYNDNTGDTDGVYILPKSNMFIMQY